MPLGLVASLPQRATVYDNHSPSAAPGIRIVAFGYVWIGTRTLGYIWIYLNICECFCVDRGLKDVERLWDFLEC